MINFQIIKEWIEKAEEDYKFALINLEENNSFYAQICFHFT